MFSTLLTVALFFAPAIQVALADFTIETDPITQCQDVTFKWGAGQGPYDIVVTEASSPCGTPLAVVGENIKDTSFTWKDVPLAAGTKVQVSIGDSSDAEAWTGVITVGGSSDDSCLGDASAKKPASSSTTSSATTGTTGTTIKPAGAAANSLKASTPSASPSPSLDPLGGLGNAGSPLGTSGAAALRQTNFPLVAMGAIIGALALAL